MTRYLLFGALVICVGLACWDLGYRGARAYERMLTQRVENGLDVLGFRWAEIRADGLKLELHGHAPDVFAQELALESARATAPIARVVNYATATLAPPEQRDPVHIELHRDERGITLIGQTASRRMRDALNMTLARYDSSIKIQDLTGIQAADPPRSWGPELRVAAMAATALPNAFVVAEPGRVSVDAQTADEAERDALTQRLLDAAEGKVSVVLRLKTPSFVIAPFTFAAHKDIGGGIRLESCATRNADEQAAIRSRLGALSIELQSDACPVGLGGPSGNWVAAINAGLDALEKLPAGRLEIAYRAARLVGHSPTSPKVFDAVQAEFLASLPGLYVGDGQLRADDAATLHGISRSSYWMHLRADEAGLSITGQVPDETARLALTTYASALFGSARVTSQLARKGGPAPAGWESAVLKVSELLSELGRGEAQLAGHRLSLAAQIDDPVRAPQLHRGLQDGLTDFEIETRFQVDLPKIYREIELPAKRCSEELSKMMQARPLDFDTGSAVLTKDSQNVIDALATILGRCNGDTLEIGGHTDAQGSEDLNMRLSKARADAVRTALIERGVRMDELVARGYGETVPIADNKTDAGRARNRRIEFKPAE